MTGHIVNVPAHGAPTLEAADPLDPARLLDIESDDAYAIPLTGGAVLVSRRNGILDALPLNSAATALVTRYSGVVHTLGGDAIIAETTPQGNLRPLMDEEDAHWWLDVATDLARSGPLLADLVRDHLPPSTFRADFLQP